MGLGSIDLPVVYFRRGHWWMRLASEDRARRAGRSRRFCQRQALLCFQAAELGAVHFPGEGEWMADSQGVRQ